jgi:hypothetical protein
VRRPAAYLCRTARIGFEETSRYERPVDGEMKTVVWTERGK